MESRPLESKEDAVLDVMPLRSLSPMFIADHCFNTTFTSSDASPRGGGFPANGTCHGEPVSPFFRMPVATSISPIKLDEEPEQTTHTSSSSRKNKRRGNLSGVDGLQTESNERKKKKQRKKHPKITDLSMILPSSVDPRESIEGVLMTFDALRRRLMQLDEVTNVVKHPHMKAGTIMMTNDLRANTGKRIGHVPGVEIGDIFYFRIEACLVGLHAPSMAGIDYMNTKIDGIDELAAISIVSSGGYDNEEGDVDALVYTGQGGGGGDKKLDDQKLERGNLALERSLHKGNLVRVIRGMKDINCSTSKIYIYDGLYKIQESWTEKGKSGFNVFKYKLFREPGQPKGIAWWKCTEEWRANPSSRGGIIVPDISFGIENVPVCLVNEIDDEKGPVPFTYTTTVKYMNPISTMRPLQGCMCPSVCLPGDANCSCAQQNEGNLPYSSSGLLVSRKAIIYECNNSCPCSINCRNRVTQKGIKLHFEVFKTKERGWGLRSWDPIRAGTFICEYTGEVTNKIEVMAFDHDDQYNFRATYGDEKTLKWNYVPELLGEPSTNCSEIIKPLPIIISAKKMGNVARFMNHSCSPNVFCQPVINDHSDERYPHFMFFAIKHIPPMTELTFDYGVSSSEGLNALALTRGPLKCLCRSSKCRGLFG